MAECWIGPVITMVINTISPENKGFAVSAFLFCSTVSGTIANATLGALLGHFGAKGDPNAVPPIDPKPQLYGYFICGFVVVAYALSLPFFYLCGSHYTAIKLKQRAEKEREALDSTEMK